MIILFLVLFTFAIFLSKFNKNKYQKWFLLYRLLLLIIFPIYLTYLLFQDDYLRLTTNNAQNIQIINNSTTKKKIYLLDIENNSSVSAIHLGAIHPQYFRNYQYNKQDNIRKIIIAKDCLNKINWVDTLTFNSQKKYVIQHNNNNNNNNNTIQLLEDEMDFQFQKQVSFTIGICLLILLWVVQWMIVFNHKKI